ncbi:unnamed protein product [Caenorhabditis angaria]|uniref:Amidohydrolase-related domain-containing protein n=1 Tax=Caenorhabditis angaria TaxID=860376 RepID=A0A9P1N597_9PELO|nr:unnamed protein product [Caenorhabditis angaria]
MDVRNKTIFFAHALIDGQLVDDVEIHVDSDGRIQNIATNRVKPATFAIDLRRHVALPGFVNTHSHAFHRFLRGRSEIGKSAADTFWKWRDNMYGLVADVDKEKIYEYCHTTFTEMLNSGITSVGEFHYVHHSAERFDLDSAVIQAAIDSGIRLVLLETLYERAGFDSPPIHPIQERFISTLPEFLSNFEKLRKSTKHPRVTIGVAAHSARAVPFETIEKLLDYAQTIQVPFHIHLEEQPKEIADCQKEFGGSGPSDMILSKMRVDQTFTAVHATYTPSANMQKFAKLGANVSICPCTEGYLGDGIPKINDKLDISFGTDCNNRIGFLEEMRWACFSQQMLNNSRSVSGLSPNKLLRFATQGGARSLGLTNTIGSLKIGEFFDAVIFSLDSPVLKFTNSSEEIIDSIVLSCGNREISHVFVSGRDRKT